MVDFSRWVGGYAINMENLAYLEQTSKSATFAAVGDMPEEVDPREHALAKDNWLQVENQGSIGSCQGNALTENVEFCYTLHTGKVLQLSRMFAYIASQRYDRINGDQGSTLSGGTKVVENIGLCRESIAPYPRGYPGHRYITDAMTKDAGNFKLKSHTTLRSASAMKAYIGSGIGIVQIGIRWGNAMTPDGNGCIKRYYVGGGGHSVAFAGYVTDETVGQRSSAGWWMLLKNSWGTRWGQNGYAYIDPSAVDQMVRSDGTFIGRSDMLTPEPAINRIIDFTKNCRYG